jgi:acyl-CoA thioesterase-2
MSFTIETLLASLALTEAGPDRYTATHAEPDYPVVFGGQLMAQSIIAARRGVEDKSVKTLHIVFARPASPTMPLEIAVDRMHAGRGLASSTVTLTQGDTLCSRAQVLMTADEPDLIRHADTHPAMSKPEEATPWPTDLGDWELRAVDGVDINDPALVGPAELDVWSRFTGAPSDPLTGQALLAFATDMFLIGTAMRPHEGVGQSQAHKTLSTGVLSHTITFHEPVDASEWLLLAHHSSYAGHGRSYGRADVFRTDGSLVASYVQDNMIRARAGAPGSL